MNSLLFWVQGSNAQKIYFMLFERGPWAFVDGTIKLVKDSVVEGSSIKQLCYSASSHISQRITMLNGLRSSLATFLAQVLHIFLIASLFHCYCLYFAFLSTSFIFITGITHFDSQIFFYSSCLK